MFKKLVLFVFIAVLVILAYGWMRKESWVSSAMSYALQTDVNVSTISLSPNSVTIRNLDIKNPPPSEIDTAFSGPRIYVQASPMELLNDLVTIDEISVDSAYMGIELFDVSGRDSNWSRMINKMVAEEEASANTDDAADAPSKQLLVKKVVIKDLQVEIINKVLNKKPIKPSPMTFELKDFSTENPLSMRELMLIITRKVFKEVALKSNMGGLVDNLKDQPKNLLDKVKGDEEGKSRFEKGKETIKNLFN